jgi:hypothetical protein
MTTEQKLREALRTIALKARHHIPFYAYGDNEAGCRMSGLLNEIAGIADSWCTSPQAATTRGDGGEGHYSEGIMSDGACILYDGQPVPIEDVVALLNAPQSGEKEGSWLPVDAPNVPTACDCIFNDPPSPIYTIRNKQWYRFDLPALPVSSTPTNNGERK